MVRINKNNLEFTKGDTCVLRVELVDETNTPVDLTTCTGLLTVKEYLNDSTFAEKISVYCIFKVFKNITFIFFASI